MLIPIFIVLKNKDRRFEWWWNRRSKNGGTLKLLSCCFKSLTFTPILLLLVEGRRKYCGCRYKLTVFEPCTLNNASEFELVDKKIKKKRNFFYNRILPWLSCIHDTTPSIFHLVFCAVLFVHMYLWRIGSPDAARDGRYTHRSPVFGGNDLGAV